MNSPWKPIFTETLLACLFWTVAWGASLWTLASPTSPAAIYWLAVVSVAPAVVFTLDALRGPR